ncbi:enoyl-CoA hydratase-related protein [Nocardioides acrostichi]|uniref:enoyl-CoA hydratase-related protein n=1 Tax=Nocardioides acrostichi TaxID=2784339 RepID=UPI001A9C6F85|nr:enoyl-CoA hydratase-related protein [Nocardioides acrostichi]
MEEQPAAGAPSVEVAVTDGVATLRLRNPRRKNAITADMAADIVAFCERVDTDETIGAVVVAGEGGYFCSGADTRDLGAASDDPATTDSMLRTTRVYSSFVRVGRLPVPTVAVMVGGAVGAGMNLALACDVVLATPTAVLDSGFLARGIHPGGGHFSLLGRGLSRSQAMAMGALGAPVSGEQAVSLGLVWATYDEHEIEQQARSLAARAGSDPELSRRIKHSADLELGPNATSWAAAVELERGVQMWSLRRKGEAGWTASRSGG